MAAFSTFEDAETRAYAKRLDKTWVNAHAARQVGGTICVRVQRYMSASNPAHGAWVEITDDGQT